MVPFGLGRNLQPVSSSLRRILQEMYSILFPERELILISSDVTAYARAFCGTRAHIFPSFLGKSSELPFQNFDSL